MAELQQLREKLMESEKLMSEATRSWQEKLAQTEARKREEMDELKVKNLSIRGIQCYAYNNIIIIILLLNEYCFKSSQSLVLI
ncbi:MAG: hypothetical protein MJE68_31435 [Proteobacteria bacterium]|nr:hypothetical protein [Pseudomonadota bacterium]